MQKLTFILTLGVLLVSAGTGQAGITEGLLLYYPFEGNANDATSGQHHGSSVGGIAYMSGAIGRAVQFDGTNDYIYTQYTPAFKTDDHFTIAFWIKCGPQPDDTMILGYKKDLKQGISFNFYQDTLVATLYDDSGAQSGLQSTSTLSDNTWHHVAMVVDGPGGTLSLYIDGVGQDTGQRIGSADINADHSMWFALGAQNHSVDGIIHYYSGSMDDLRFYNRSLTVADLTQLMELHQGTTYPIGDDSGFWEVTGGGGFYLVKTQAGFLFACLLDGSFERADFHLGTVTDGTAVIENLSPNSTLSATITFYSDINASVTVNSCAGDCTMLPIDNPFIINRVW